MVILYQSEYMGVHLDDDGMLCMINEHSGWEFDDTPENREKCIEHAKQITKNFEQS